MFDKKSIVKISFVVCLSVGLITKSAAVFRDEFKSQLKIDKKESIKGWNYFTGDGKAVMDFKSGDEDYATIIVDASKDRKNIWWALIKRYVSEQIKLEKLAEPNKEIRIEARIRTSHAPRRVNLSVNTQRSVNYHKNLMEFYIPDTMKWQKISFTTKGFNARIGDSVYAQLALMDWGLEKYRVDLDYYKVEVVDVNNEQRQYGIDLPYHPPIPDLSIFNKSIIVEQDAIISKKFFDMNFKKWSTIKKQDTIPVVNVSQGRTIILKWKLDNLSKTRVSRAGLLEMNTENVEKFTDTGQEVGLIRVSEIVGGKTCWRDKSITYQKFKNGRDIEKVINPQMIIDVKVRENNKEKILITIPKYIIQKMIEGKTKGIAIRALSPINVSFYSSEYKDGKYAPELHLKYK